VPSAEFTYPIEGKCDLAAGFAYRYPYNTNSFFTQFTTLISIKRKVPADKQSAEEVRAPDPDQIRAAMGNYFNDAVKFYEKGEYKKAIEQWEKVLELDPEHSESKRLIRQAEEKLNEK